MYIFMILLRIYAAIKEVLFYSGCNLVGFHTEDYCLNFIDCCQRILGCRVDKERMIVYNTMCRSSGLVGNRHCSYVDGVHIKALPIGIPYKRFESLSRSANRVFTDSNCQIILGVDRLDYTKGYKRFRQ